MFVCFRSLTNDFPTLPQPWQSCKRIDGGALLLKHRGWKWRKDDLERDGDDVCINDDGDDDADNLYDCYLKRLRVVGIQATPLLSDLDLKAG